MELQRRTPLRKKKTSLSTRPSTRPIYTPCPCHDRMIKAPHALLEVRCDMSRELSHPSVMGVVVLPKLFSECIATCRGETAILVAAFHLQVVLAGKNPRLDTGGWDVASHSSRAAAGWNPQGWMTGRARPLDIYSRPGPPPWI